MENSNLSSSNWLENNPKKSLLVFYLIFIVLLEVLVRLLAYNGYIPIKYFPTSSAQNRFLGDINKEFGVWHYPDRETKVKSACFDVTYSSNSYGARDIKRTKKSKNKNRIVALGDSFVEGVGVEINSRMTNIVEKKTNQEVLNFGTSGDFGSIQQSILYQKLASEFDHNEVHIYLLPDNDFKDNDPENFTAKRYRPYLRKNKKGQFEIYYTTDFKNREKPKDFSALKKIRAHLYNNIYLLNLIRQFGYFMKDSELHDILKDDIQNIPSYDNFTDEDFEKLLYSYNQIIKAAEDRPVKIFIIPRIMDIDLYLEEENKRKIYHKLKDFYSDNNNVEVYDFLPYFIEYARNNNINHDDFFHSCDGHWSALGNRVAARFVINSI